MAKYSDIKGFTVQTLSSDPGATQFAAGSWASDAPAPQQTQSGGSFGTSTAAVSTGGYDGSTYVQTTIEYNGSSWSSGGSMNRPAGQSFPGFGTEPSGGIAGGYKTSGNAVVNNFESYNGTAFTESTDLNSARQQAGATGASATAGIVVGGTSGVGSPPDTTGNNNVEIWNGSSWTEISEINTARYAMRALGSTCPAPTAVVAGGENSGTKTGITEKYDGSSWSESGDLNTARSMHGGAGSVATSGICFGGEGPAGGGYTLYANTEHFDGSTWTEVSDLSGVRYSFSTATGTGTAAIAAQGRNPGYTGLTEIWSAPATFQKTTEGQLYFNSTTNTFKETLQDAAAGAWASIASGNTARRVASGAGGSTSDGIVIGGYPQENEVETWNGSSWTEVAEINTARGDAGASSGSPSSSALFFGGDARPGGASRVDNNESWNGSAWTETGDLPASVNGNAGAGVSNTSALSFGGSLPAKSGATYDWNGSSWTSGGTMSTARYYLSGAGTATAALALGGFRTSPASAILKSAESYDGSSWTDLSNTNSGHSFGGAAGTTTSAMLFGGEGPGYPGGAQTATENWNGTAWTEVADISTGNNSPAGFGGSGLSCISSFGNTPSGLLATAEEFTGGLANKTITAS